MRYKILILFCFLGLWQGCFDLYHVPYYVMPTPFEIMRIFCDRFDYLFQHLGVSLLEILLGLLIGFCFAILTAAFLDRFQRLQVWILPYLVILKNIPIFVLAPFLLLWFGHGMGPKAFLIALSCYFPMAIGLLEGLQSCPKSDLDFIHMVQTPSWHWTLLYLRLPHALPRFFMGFRLAMMHAPMSVLVCDWIGSGSGLGYVMMLCYGQMNLAMMFACLLLLVGISLCFYQSARFLDHYCLRKLNIKGETYAL